MTWNEMAQHAGWPAEQAGYALWNCSAFPFSSVRETWYDLRSAWRLSERAGFFPDSPGGGFR